MKKLTHEQFIVKLKQSNTKFSNGDFVLLSKYINNRTKILVEGKYGQCLITPPRLLKGVGPCIDNAIDKTKYFINSSNKVHKHKYTYKKTKYVNSQTKVIITCSEHGDFNQTPDAHYNQGQGCKECKRYSRLDSRRLSTEDFIIRANKIHNNYYDYSKSIVNGNKNKLIITCKIHGDFLQSPNSHLKGRGCKQCYLDNNGYGKSKFVHFAKNNTCLLYLIEVFNNDERFLKIGITSKDVETRFGGDKKLPYDYTIIKTISSESSSFIWDEEIKLKRKFKKYQYIPKIKFKGYTECFDLLQKENIYNYLGEIY